MLRKITDTIIHRHNVQCCSQGKGRYSDQFDLLRHKVKKIVYFMTEENVILFNVSMNRKSNNSDKKCVVPDSSFGIQSEECFSLLITIEIVKKYKLRYVRCVNGEPHT